MVTTTPTDIGYCVYQHTHIKNINTNMTTLRLFLSNAGAPFSRDVHPSDLVPTDSTDSQASTSRHARYNVTGTPSYWLASQST